MRAATATIAIVFIADLLKSGFPYYKMKREYVSATAPGNVHDNVVDDDPSLVDASESTPSPLPLQ